MKKIILIFTCLSLCISAYAQQDFTVSVVDAETREPVTNISILLTNQDRGTAITQKTNEQGKTIFKSIPAVNGYQVFFEGNDQYGPNFTQKIDVRSNQNPNIQLRLSKSINTIQDLKEVVISNSSSAKINRRDAEVSFELKAKEIEEIPVEGRDITRVLFRLPNVTQATGVFS
jgi:hypothetical protein